MRHDRTAPNKQSDAKFYGRFHDALDLCRLGVRDSVDLQCRHVVTVESVPAGRSDIYRRLGPDQIGVAVRVDREGELLAGKKGEIDAESRS